VADPEPARVHQEQVGSNRGLERRERLAGIDAENLGDLVLVAALLDHGGDRHRDMHDWTHRPDPRQEH
jgi:hypothetical protein